MKQINYEIPVPQQNSWNFSLKGGASYPAVIPDQEVSLDLTLILYPLGFLHLLSILLLIVYSG